MENAGPAHSAEAGGDVRQVAALGANGKAHILEHNRHLLSLFSIRSKQHAVKSNRWTNNNRGTNIVKALTLWQPHGRLVQIGRKRIETRDWSTRYRGILSIHIAQRYPDDCKELAAQKLFRLALGYGSQEYAGWERRDFDCGCVVALVILADVRMVFPVAPDCGHTSGFMDPPPRPEFDFGNYAAGRYGWMFSEAVSLDRPVRCKGNRLLWNLPPTVEDEVYNAIGDKDVRERYRALAN